MLNAGNWVSQKPGGSHVGFYLNSLYSPWLTFSEIAYEFLSSKNARESLQNFHNSWLAEPWEDRVSSISLITSDDEEGKLFERGVIPSETQLLTAGVDWHGEKKGLYWSVWAWASGRRGWLIDYGLVYSEPDLDQLLYARKWATETSAPLHGRLLVGVDSGFDAAAVYDFTRRRFPQTRPTKGVQTLSGATIRDSAIDHVDRKTGRRFKGFSLLLVNTDYYKDQIANYIKPNDDDEDEGQRLFMCRGVGKDFVAHLEAECKVRDNRGKFLWQPRYHGAANHWLDTCVIASAIADRFGAAHLPNKEATGKRTGGQTPPQKSSWIGQGFTISNQKSWLNR